MGVLDGFAHIVRENEPLAAYTWLRLGGPARYFAEPTSVDELAALIRRCREAELPVHVLGGGSNLLVREQGVAGLVVFLSAATFSEIQVAGSVVRAGGGAKLGHVISTAVRDGLAGLEPLVGIPGTIGGALHGNSGIQNHDIGQCTTSATVMTRAGEILVHGPHDLRFAYRQSSLDELVILSAELTLEPDDPQDLIKRMQTQWIVKKARQPSGGTTAARIFKNPPGITARTLVEMAGLHGARVGEAEVSTQHANFVVAHPGCRSDDVLELIDLVRQRVLDQLGVELEKEIEIW